MPKEIAAILLIVVGYLGWIVVVAMMSVMKYMSELLVAYFPWFVLIGGCVGIVCLIFGKPGRVKKG